ncbi:TlpA disulfide reductase family protein [Pseudomonas tohonis]|uniref:TlpA disulfide reductase family protein n=1 Tax=Pseudomonas tohonis TaxID=2725477 RepID=UPI0022EFE5AD|nr:TlpA disulfide reductase family protein [Pseudomonas tohonis]
MTSFNLGPLAIPAQNALLYLGFFAALFSGWLAGRRRQANPEGTLFLMLLLGVLAARLAFVARYWEQYAPAPLALVDIRDGGFLLWPGLAAAVLVAALQARRQPAVRRPLAIAMLVGATLWGGGSAVLGALERGRQLPEVALTDLAGKPVDLRERDGRPLVVNLWASWCPPCRREMPALQAAQQARPDLRFVLVNQGENAEHVKRFLKEQGLVLDEVLLDGGNRLGALTGSYGLPTTLFYDRDGRLQHSHMGELSGASLNRALESLAGD